MLIATSAVFLAAWFAVNCVLDGMEMAEEDMSNGHF